MMRTRLTTLLLLLLTATSATATELLRFLEDKEAPPGIVIEIVSGDRDLLRELLPEVRSDIEKLRAKFPDLSIAIVSHGSEQFSLTTEQRREHAGTHQLVEQLVKQDKINVHVCGTHASWYNVMPEDFPDYVDVTPAGPAQINDYEELGYELIVLP